MRLLCQSLLEQLSCFHTIFEHYMIIKRGGDGRPYNPANFVVELSPGPKGDQIRLLVVCYIKCLIKNVCI